MRCFLCVLAFLSAGWVVARENLDLAFRLPSAVCLKAVPLRRVPAPRTEPAGVLPVQSGPFSFLDPQTVIGEELRRLCVSAANGELSKDCLTAYSPWKWICIGELKTPSVSVSKIPLRTPEATAKEKVDR